MMSDTVAWSDEIEDAIGGDINATRSRVALLATRPLCTRPTKQRDS